MALFRVLPVSALAGKAHLASPAAPQPLDKLLAEPALTAMTDLTQMPAASISSDEPIGTAHQRMLERRVRMLFVLDHKQHVVGLVTNHDLLGEKPMQIVISHGVRHDEIRVRDVMTTAEDVEVLDARELSGARVGDIVETLRSHARQHALVVQHNADGAAEICGVFSAADLSRKLGVPVVPVAVSHSFAEIEQALAQD